MKELSVIIVTKNEATNIGPCIESVLRETSGIDTEIVVVDSRSDDGTLDVARRYPVRTFCLNADALITSHAGRFVGTRESSGRYLCYLDGDMVVIPGWISYGLEALKDERLGAVAGRLFRVYPGEDLSFAHIDNYRLGPTYGFGGAGLYRGELIRRYGTFNPFMRGEGERELGHRLRQGGVQLMRVDVPMVYHMEKQKDIGEVDEKAGMYGGVGQILRRYPLRDIFWSLLWYHRLVFLQILVIWGAVLVPLILLLAGQLRAGTVFVVLECAGALALVLWKGWTKVYLFVRSRILMSLNVIKGLFYGLPDQKTYDARYSQVSGPGASQSQP